MKKSEQRCMSNDDIDDCDCERLRDDFTALKTDNHDVYCIGIEKAIKTNPKSFFWVRWSQKKKRVGYYDFWASAASGSRAICDIFAELIKGKALAVLGFVLYDGLFMTCTSIGMSVCRETSLQGLESTDMYDFAPYVDRCTLIRIETLTRRLSNTCVMFVFAVLCFVRWGWFNKLVVSCQSDCSSLVHSKWRFLAGLFSLQWRTQTIEWCGLAL
jgi:hypothetical protein